MKRFLLILPFCLLFLGCASEQEEADLHSVQQANIPPSLYRKMSNEVSLDVSDVIELSHRHVDDALIMRYMRRVQTVYYLNTKQINRMKSAGVDGDVINYMLSTPRIYSGYYNDPGYYGYGPYYGDPYYDPFFYGGGTVFIGGRGHFHHHGGGHWHH